MGLPTYLRSRQSLQRWSVYVAGIPFAAVLLWEFGSYGGLYFQAFIVALGLAGAWLWGFLMWEFYVKAFYKVPPDNGGDS